MGMELKVWVDGIQRVVCGVSEQTTCQEVVIALARAIGEPSLSAGGMPLRGGKHVPRGCPICRCFLGRGRLGWVGVLLWGGGDVTSHCPWGSSLGRPLLAVAFPI